MDSGAFKTMRNPGKLLMTGAVLGLTAGCAHAPVASTGTELVEEASLAPFWQRYQDDQLSGLVEEGLAANTDIAIAMARFDAAEARAKAARARLFPSLGAAAGVSRTEGFAGTGLDPLAVGTGQLDLAYEVDLFGAIRKGHRSALARSRSARLELEAMRLAISCRITQLYIAISALDAQVSALDEQMEITAALRQVIDRRSAEREAGAIERGLIEQQVASLGAERAALVSARAAQTAALAVLVGRDATVWNEQSSDAFVASFEKLPDLAIADEQPFAMLEVRPDVMAAQSDLAAARLDVEAIKAAQMPGLRLTASGVVGLVSGGVSSILNLGASLATNLFEGGRITAANREADALARAALAAWDRARLTAAQEAVTGLAALSAARKRETYWQATGSTVERAATTAQRAYLDGDLPFNLVIDTRRNEITTRRALIDARRDRMLAQLDLVRALGGEPVWEPVRIGTR